MNREFTVNIDIASEYKNSGEVYLNYKDDIHKSITEVYRLLFMVKSEGLLSLEERSYTLEEDVEKALEYKYLQRLIRMVVDGCSANDIQFVLGNHVIN